MLSAEVIPTPGKNTEAAMALQKLGFSILHIGQSITIAGKQKLFEQVFKTKLLKMSKDILPSLPPSTATEFFKPEKPPAIPEELKLLIRDVVFPEPPEYMK